MSVHGHGIDATPHQSRQVSQKAPLPMSEKIRCVVVSGDRQMDEIMHRADLFEPFKAFASVEVLEVTLKPNTEHGKAVNDVVYAYNHCGRRVVAAFIPGRPDGAYLDESVRAISDGKKWCMLDLVLEAYRFVPRSECIATNEITAGNSCLQESPKSALLAP